MGEYADLLLTIFIAAVLCSATIWILTLKHKQERHKWEKISEDNYIRGQNDATQWLRENYEKIESDKDKLNILSDRELLIQIMLSLGSYSRRMDRMDEKLKILSHYKSYIDDMNSKARTLTQHFIILENDISVTASMINRFQNTIEEIANGISTLIEQIGSINSIQGIVTEYISQLSKIELTLQQLQSSTATIVEEMNIVMDSHDKSPMKKLKVIEMEINGLNLLTSILQENVADLSSHSEKIEQSMESASEQNQQMLQYIKESVHVLHQLKNSSES